MIRVIVYLSLAVVNCIIGMVLPSLLLKIPAVKRAFNKLFAPDVYVIFS